MKVITIRFNDQNELEFLLNLLNRLNFKFEWREEKILQKKVNDLTQPDAIAELFGSWESDMSSDELNKMLKF
jgi:hypothetical protein